MTKRDVELALPPAEAYAKVVEALRSVGKVKEESVITRSVTGKMRYGLNPVTFRGSIIQGQTADTSILQIEARGQDIYGMASRKCIDKLLGAIK